MVCPRRRRWSPYKKNADAETKKAVAQALFLAGDSHDLVELARGEKDPAVKQSLVQQLSLMHNKEATDYCSKFSTSNWKEIAP